MGDHYVQYLKDSGLDSSCIAAIEDLEEINEESYYRLKQKLENGAVFQIEVWMNDDETYSGLAQEIKEPSKREKRRIKIEIIKDVYWDDRGIQRKVFRKGWVGYVNGHYEDGELDGVSGESPIYKGVSDEIWDDCYRVLEQEAE